MVVGWSESVFLYRPTRWKDNEVSNGRSSTRRRARQQSEDGRILQTMNITLTIITQLVLFTQRGFGGLSERDFSHTLAC
jgi:hypothetical protein